MKVKEENEKVGLKLNIHKTKIMAYSPITSWQIGVETMETMADFIFWGSKTIADGDCSHEIKRWLLLGRKVMTNIDRDIKKQRHYFANKVPSSQGCGFSSGHIWMEKEMATHSSVLAWRIPGMVEPGGLSSIGSHRVGHV